MTTQITPKAASDLGQRRRIPGGKLAASRQLRGVAIVGALVLALAASLALDRALQPDQASMTAGGDASTGSIVHAVAPRTPAEACVYAGADGTPGEGCMPAIVAPVAPTQPEGCVYASVDGIPGEGCTPAEPASMPTR